MAVMQRWLEYFAVFAVVVLVTLTACCVKGAVAKHPPRMRALCSVPRWRFLVFLPIVAVLAIFASRKNPPPGGGIPTALPRLLQQLAGDPPGLRQFTDDEKAARFVLQSVDTNSEWSAAKPTGAVEPTTWALTGAFSDKYANLAVGGWEFPYLGAFPFGTNEVTRMAFLAQGEARPGLRDESTHISPLGGGLTSIPQRDRLAAAGAAFQSRFWTLHTPTNALYTWENALFLDRTVPAHPVSCQIETFPDGNFTLRHDISSLDDTAWQTFTNSVRTGAQWHGHGEMVDLSLLPKYNKAEFRYHALDERNLTDPDRDGDGITTADEIFIYHTDPGNPDTDYDGLSDLDEIFGYHTDPLNPNSLSQLYSDGFAVKLGDLDPFSYPPNSTNTVLEHIFYSGTTNGAFAYPQSTEDVAVLKISVSGTGTGSLVVGDSVVPLVAPPQMRSGAVTNTLLLNVGYGVKKLLWYRRPEGLDVALDADDFLIGELPSFPLTLGWIAFPHTEATIPCIHDLSDCRRTVRLVHGEEFSGLTATWESSAQGVTITNNPPVSAEVRARIPKNENRSIVYTVAHPKWLRGCTTFEQTLRFCPPMTHGEELAAAGSEDGFDEGDAPDPDSSVYSSAMGCACGDGGCACCNDGWCVCRDINCTCNLDRVSELMLDETEAAEAYTNMVFGSLVHMGNVLYLHNENRDIVHLDVPGGDREPCCPCPEHQNTNYVAKSACSRRLNVNWPSGERFSISHATCNVDVEGKSPSFDFRDSRVLFVTNGAPYKSGSYTVLGVDIDTELWRWPSFNDYEALSPGLGFPMTVCTNLVEAPGFVMRTDVFLSNGVVRVALENVQGEFKVWLAGWDSFGSPVSGTTELLLSSGGTVERHMPIERWRSIMRRYGGARDMYILVTSSQAGRCDLVLEFACAKGNEYVHDAVRRRITSVNPPLLTDTDRDGAIGEGDVLAYLGGRAFRYWTNEDIAKGDYAGQNSSTVPNASDLVVNGRLDLVNFFPVKLDLKPFADAWGNSATFVLWAPEGRLRFCGVDMNADSAWEHQTNDVYTTTGDPISVAELTPIVGEGAEVNSSDYLGNENAPGMLACEATGEMLAYNSPELLIIVNDVAMYRFRLPMSIMSVDEMHRWKNLRGVCGADFDFGDRTCEPGNLPDLETDDEDVFFVHGFNVSEVAARNWSRQVFKRLWLAGFRARFHGVTWYGDYRLGEDMNPMEKMNAFFYHRDVLNALNTAGALRSYVESAQSVASKRTLIAQSLGNMVVSEALRQGLEAERYFMFNAAVASEAYDSTLQDADADARASFVPPAWREYDPMSWAANWHRWFPSDDRGRMRWRGVFETALANVGEVYNFYSTGDEVLEADDAVPGVMSNALYVQWPLTFSWHRPIMQIGQFEFLTTFERNAWQKQEVMKGVNPYLATLEGGWGFHTWMAPNEFNELVPTVFTAADAAAKVADGSIVTNSIFDRSVSAMFRPSSATNEIYSVMAYNVPAVSFATGSVATFADEDMSFDLNNTLFRNGWGRNSVAYAQRWLHSDMKDMAYLFVFPLYQRLVEMLTGEDQ